MVINPDSIQQCATSGELRSGRTHLQKMIIETLNTLSRNSYGNQPAIDQSYQTRWCSSLRPVSTLTGSRHTHWSHSAHRLDTHQQRITKTHQSSSVLIESDSVKTDCTTRSEKMILKSINIILTMESWLKTQAESKKWWLKENIFILVLVTQLLHSTLYEFTFIFSCM